MNGTGNLAAIQDYDRGLTDGFVDGFVISQPINEGDHTFEKFMLVNYKYRSFISPFLKVSAYGLGYANGVDAAAIYLGIEIDGSDESE